MAKEKAPKGSGGKGALNRPASLRLGYLRRAQQYLTSLEASHPAQKASRSSGCEPTQSPSASIPINHDNHDPTLIAASATASNTDDKHSPPSDNIPSTPPPQPLPILSMQIGAQIRAVARKTQTRLAQERKRSLCKRCNVLLTERYASVAIENKSKGVSLAVQKPDGVVEPSDTAVVGSHGLPRVGAGKKPWADVLLLQCDVCGAVKRFPIGNGLQKKRRIGRKPKDPASTAENT